MSERTITLAVPHRGLWMLDLLDARDPPPEPDPWLGGRVFIIAGASHAHAAAYWVPFNEDAVVLGDHGRPAYRVVVSPPAAPPDEQTARRVLDWLNGCFSESDDPKYSPTVNTPVEGDRRGR